jgi:dTDP-4-dehydrorhamnose 3,5-epimerase
MRVVPFDKDLSKFCGGGLVLCEFDQFEDSRGWFSETFSDRKAEAAGINAHFVQDNHSYSKSAGTVRGLHFQRPPHAQAKLVRCIRGAIIDYAVDVRLGSPTYGRVASAKLTAENRRALFIPVGYAHAFITLEPNTEVVYKVSDYYAPDCDGGILWNDPEISIHWPIEDGAAVVSTKDHGLPRLADFASPFEFDGQALAPIIS